MTALTLVIAILLQSTGYFPESDANKDVEVEQLPNDTAQNIAIPNLASGKNIEPSQMPQLPPSLEAPFGDSKGEDVLKRGDQQDRKRFSDEVARVADMLRERGQQPTPETLAREIGPNALAKYLSVDPSMLDSYGAVSSTGALDMPSDTGVAIPPSPQ